MIEPNWHAQTESDPTLPTARSAVRGTRVAVDFVMELLEDGWTPQEIARHFGHIAQGDLTGNEIRADGVETEEDSADKAPEFGQPSPGLFPRPDDRA